MSVSNGELDIQRLLVRRLQRRIQSLEDERDRLVVAIRDLSTETAARIYMLEEERDNALQRVRMLQERLDKRS